MRTLLQVGVTLAFVAVAVGATFDALAIVGILALAERVERRG